MLVFLAVLAAATNLQKTFARARTGGLKAAGGYLAHVGVGVAFLGFLASSAYDQSTKVTLTQGVERMIREAIPEVEGVVDATDHARGQNPYFTAEA